MKQPLLCLYFLWCFATAAVVGDAAESSATPLPHAHAHNDYHHPRPLLDALDHGFCGVEADIFLVGEELLVGHSRDELRPNRTLRRLYLEPLRERVKQNGGRVYRQGPTITLLVDIKSDAEATYRALHAELAEYASMLTRFEKGSAISGAVTVIISGNRARQLIAGGDPRYAGIDGRLGDLDSRDASHLLPLISDNWNSHFRWRGAGDMPRAEEDKLRSIVAQAHASDRRVRFWATPEKTAVWQKLHDAGVDLINTDDLPGLQEFLRKQPRNEAGHPG